MCDAVSMYTNIDTDHALDTIGHFLRTNKMARGLPAKAILSALNLIMRWNIFKFGDMLWKQLSGTAMGTPPACVYATLYFAIHELAMPTHLQDCLTCYKRYIDGGIGIWTGPDLLWTEFQDWTNSFGSLRWTFSELSRTIDYLDITIRIDAKNNIRTTLFEKPLNLYQHRNPGPGQLNPLKTHSTYSTCHMNQSDAHLSQ
jgi:hypothetical protein